MIQCLVLPLLTPIPQYHYLCYHRRHSQPHIIKVTRTEKKSQKVLMIKEILLFDIIADIAEQVAIYIHPVKP
jgi:hypothetical protein